MLSADYWGGGGDANYVDDDIGRGTRNFFQRSRFFKVDTNRKS